jgi:formamidopyrimidine-DNA glycosylase
VPELPDITVYIEALEKRILGQALVHAQITGVSLLRTAQPPITSLDGKKVIHLSRVGKRIAIGLEDDLWLVLHLMTSGRLHWRERTSKTANSRVLASFVFSNGTLSLTEAGSQRRASLYLLQGKEAFRVLDPGGIEVLQANLESFTTALQAENHTLKRALTDPHLFSGIGNAYSDEILFAARLSPTTLTKRLTAIEIERLFRAVQDQLVIWTERLRVAAGDKFPEKVTAFRPEMAVHGRYKQPCLRCGGKIQRIRYATNETNYCPSCQTGGKLLADRSLSRLLRDDWPKNVEDLENVAAAYVKKNT